MPQDMMIARRDIFACENDIVRSARGDIPAADARKTSVTRLTGHHSANTSRRKADITENRTCDASAVFW